MHLQDLPENSAVIIQREIRKAPKRGLLHLHFNGVGKSALLGSVTQPLVSSNVFQAESTLNQVNVYQNFSRKFKQMINFRLAAFSHIHMLHSIHRRFCILHQLGNAISRTIGMAAECIRQCTALWRKLCSKLEIKILTKMTRYFHPHFHFLFFLVFPGIPLVKTTKMSKIHFCIFQKQISQ